MDAWFTGSQLNVESSVEGDRAWHLCTILLQLRRPAPPEELAMRCTLFHASPSLVVFLCSFPNSPLRLTENRYVTVSWFAFRACCEFLSMEMTLSTHVNWLGVSASEKLSIDHLITYFKKRKCSTLTGSPVAKRRLLDRHGGHKGKETQTLISISNPERSNFFKVHVDGAERIISGFIFGSGNMRTIDCTSQMVNQEKQISALLLEGNSMPSGSTVNTVQCVGDRTEGEIKCDDADVERGFQSRILGKTGFCQSKWDKVFKSALTTDAPRTPQFVDGEDEAEMKCDGTASMLQSRSAGIATGTSNTNAEVDDKLRLSGLDAGAICSVSTVATVKWKGEMQKASKLMLAIIHDNEANNSVLNCLEAENPFIHLIDDGEGATDEVYLPKEQASRVTVKSSKDFDANTAQRSVLLKNDRIPLKPIQNTGLMETLAKKQEDNAVESLPQPSIEQLQPLFSRKLPKKSCGKTKHLTKNMPFPESDIPLFNRDKAKAITYYKNEKLNKIDENCIHGKLKMKRNQNRSIHIPLTENKADSTSKCLKGSNTKPLPKFELFDVVEEEGSGGYGTVYKARRKNDGKIVALKCPHINAPSHHVNNELKMLERYGGQNFVIKYEGSFRNGNSECFVLEHVEHERPEVLKREIEVCELHWYGYCMFKALAWLHKQGIVHRDVKPGNFLFSRKFGKGYLIDFNLAMDLHHKYSESSRLKKMGYGGYLDHVPCPSGKDASGAKESGKVVHRVFEAANRAAAKKSRQGLFNTNNFQKVGTTINLNTLTDLGNRSLCRSQGGDGSGVTSARTPSAERLKEPIPCQGRKELISLVQEAMQSPKCMEVASPASQRKRVAAPLRRADRGLVYLSPMPLVSGGIPVLGASQLNRGSGKLKKEGPCVGTKGFRAPEVLLKSPFQGSKVDMWSAGVTLLYLMIGRSPFVGDPEHNLKEIAKLRGSEDLWEVAKLHNRECSFPEELLDIQALPSLDIRGWCEVNTKRPELYERLPASLFDLVDKCLTVNPRLRISAEDALRHDFFGICHEALKKQRRLRRPLPDSKSHLAKVQLTEEVCPVTAIR